MPLSPDKPTDTKLQTWGANAADQVVRAAIHGAGPMKGAVVVAEQHLATYPDQEKAIQRLIATHVRLAAASGFLTGLGGVVTLPVAIPASLAGLYVLGARMSAGIAHLRGYDVESEEVRSAVLISLLGSGGTEVLKRTGVEVGKKTTAAAFQRIPGRVLIEINKRIGFRLVTKAGEKGVVNLAKLVPLVGAPVGAAFDGIGCRTIATFAQRIFERVDDPVAGDVIVVENEAHVLTNRSNDVRDR
jgi:EcsC protein family